MKTRFPIFLILYFLLLCLTPAFSQTFEWATKAGGTGNDEGNSIAVDAAGNSYVIGNFTGSAAFGSFSLLPTQLVNIFSPDAIFISKFDAAGKIIWAKKVSDSNLDYGNDIAVDATGNIYVSGGFSGTVFFGNTSLTSSAFGDMYLARYDTDGNFRWAKRAGGGSFTLANGLALDAVGNCYVTGYFRGSVTFDNITLANVGRDDLFLTKYDKNGNVTWARNAGDRNSSVVGYKVAVSPTGSPYVTGYFFGAVAFGSIILPGNNPQFIRIDSFVAKYNPDGTLAWARQLNCELEDYPGGLAVDNAGNCYLTGTFNGSFTIDNNTLVSTGGFDIYTIKFSNEGSLLWAQKAGGTGTDEGKSVVVVPDQTIYVGGIFSGTAAFGNTNLTAAGEGDIFLARFTQPGQQTKVLKAGGLGADRLSKLAADPEGNVYLTGNFSKTGNFPPQSLTSSGDLDVYTAKFGFPFLVPLTLILNPIETVNYCSGESLPVYFTRTGVFNTDNQFIVQLSDAVGSFTNPIIIGSGLNSPITSLIPVTIPTGTKYRIRVVSTSPALLSNDNGYDLELKPIGLAILPNIITPNGDGRNDYFKVAAPCTTFDLNIYNHWGKLVFHRKNYQDDWDGSGIPAGTYYYLLSSFNNFQLKGWVEIIR